MLEDLVDFATTVKNFQKVLNFLEVEGAVAFSTSKTDKADLYGSLETLPGS